MEQMRTKGLITLTLEHKLSLQKILIRYNVAESKPLQLFCQYHEEAKNE